MKLNFRYSTDEDSQKFFNALLIDTEAIDKLQMYGNRSELWRNDSANVCFTAFNQDGIVGFLRLNSADSTGFNYLADLYILPEHRKKKYGYELIKFAKEYSQRNWNAIGIDLFTIENPIMDRLIKKCGFTLGVNDKKRYYRHGKFLGQKRWYFLYESLS